MEWTVVTVVIALAGFLTAVVRPVVELNTSIAKLASAVGTLQENLRELTSRNDESHARLWEHNAHQDGVLCDHETRITVIERSGEGGRPGGGHRGQQV